MGLKDNALKTADALDELAGKLREVKEELSAGAVIEAARRSSVGSVGPRTSGEITRGTGGGGGGNGRVLPGEGGDAVFVSPLGGGPLVSTAVLETECELAVVPRPGGGTMEVYRCPWGAIYPATTAPPRRSGTGEGGGAGGGLTTREASNQRRREANPGGIGGGGGGVTQGSVGIFGNARAEGTGASSVVSEIRNQGARPTAGERQIVDGLRGVKDEIGQLRNSLRSRDEFGAGLRVGGGL